MIHADHRDAFQREYEAVRGLSTEEVVALIWSFRRPGQVMPGKTTCTLAEAYRQAAATARARQMLGPSPVTRAALVGDP